MAIEQQTKAKQHSERTLFFGLLKFHKKREIALKSKSIGVFCEIECIEKSNDVHDEFFAKSLKQRRAIHHGYNSRK